MTPRKVRAAKTVRGTFVVSAERDVFVHAHDEPDAAGAWWADAYMDLPKYPGLEARATVRSLDGVVQITELIVTQGHAVIRLDETGAPVLGIAPDHTGGVTTAALRDVPVATIVRKARAALAEAASEGLISAASADAFRDRRRVGRRGRSDIDYARFAASYVEWCAKSATPVKDMGESEFLDPSTVRNILYEARERGLLSSSGRGKAGGALTAEGLRLLKEDDDGTR